MKKKDAYFIPTPAFRRFCDQCESESKRILNLQDWRVTFEFIKRVDGYAHLHEERGSTMEVEVDKVYMDAMISVAKVAQDIFKDGDFATLQNDFLHELCHVLTWDAYEKVTPTQKRIDLEENLTQKIAVIASKLLCA